MSPVAEFTPKAVQTEELRTSLAYEIRVFVKDPSDELRLGMPATVYLTVNQTERPGDRERRKQEREKKEDEIRRKGEKVTQAEKESRR
jgi:hypothetical protein